MQMVCRYALLGASVLLPSAALAEGMIIQEPALVEEVVQEPAGVLVAPPAYGGPLTEAEAQAIALAEGLAVVEDVHRRWIDGDFEVDGTMPTGQEVELVIDADTGAIIEVDN